MAINAQKEIKLVLKVKHSNSLLQLSRILTHKIHTQEQESHEDGVIRMGKNICHVLLNLGGGGVQSQRAGWWF